MKTILATIFVIFSFTALHAQAPPVIHWEKSFGGSALDGGKILRPTTDGGYILGGYTTSNGGEIAGFRDSVDAVLFKLDASGSVQWQRCYGGSGQEGLNDLLQTADGGYILLCSSTSNDFDVTGNHGQADTWIVKVNAGGSIEWQKSYGGPGREVFAYSRIVASPGGGFVISTITTANGGDVSGHHPPVMPTMDVDIWVFKIDNNGNMLWQRCLGGGKSDYPGALITTTGGYIIAGGVTSTDGDVTCSFLPGQYGSLWIVKLDESGNILWEKCPTRDGSAIAGQQTSDGGFIFTGSCLGPGGVANIYLLKTDANGEIQWERCYGGFDYDIGEAVSITQDGGYVITGNISRAQYMVCKYRGGFDIWVIRTDANGEMIWQQSYGGTLSETAFSILETPDQGFLMAGMTVSVDGDINGQDRLGYSDMWLVKLGFPGIEILPAVSITASETYICPGKSITFIATPVDGGDMPVYQWQVNGVNTATNNDTIVLNTIADGDIVTCILTSSSPCVTTRTVGSNSIHVTVDPLATPANFLDRDTVICEYGTIDLKATGNYKTYAWSNGATTPILTITQPGTYWLNVTSQIDCPGSDTILVTLKECIKGFYMPTAFTPNGDGRNDILKPILGGRILKYEFTIANRWGQVVFRTNEPGKGWDGTFNGKKQDSNVFVWTCSYQFDGEDIKFIKGTVTIIR